MKTIWQQREITLFLLILTACLLMAVFAPSFFAAATLSSVLNNALVLLLLSIGTMFVIITRNIDVSGGSMLGLCAAVLGIALSKGLSLGLAIICCLLTGIVAGFFNAILVAWLNIPAIIATLGTMGLYRGIMLMLTQGKWIENLPQSLKNLNTPVLFGLSCLLMLVIVIIIATAYFLTRSKRGQYLYAIGDNIQAAKNLGIAVKSTQIQAFVLSGLMAALAGIIFAAQIGFIPNQAGNGLELKAIAANVLGGVSLLGGLGSVMGVVMSVLFLTGIDSALVFLKIPAFWNDLIAGAILLIILFFDGRLRLFAQKQMRKQRYARQISTTSQEQT